MPLRPLLSPQQEYPEYNAGFWQTFGAWPHSVALCCARIMSETESLRIHSVNLAPIEIRNDVVGPYRKFISVFRTMPGTRVVLLLYEPKVVIQGMQANPSKPSGHGGFDGGLIEHVRILV